MKFVIFGLSISSSWGNGHATLWRALCRALIRRKHQVVFYERDVPYYAAHRDLVELPGLDLQLYSDWDAILPGARKHLAEADVGMVTSYCFDALPASELVLDCPAKIRCFYDLDTPVTLEKIQAGQKVDYIPGEGLGDFDLVLSFTGGCALQNLQVHLGAQRVAPLYGSVDLESYHPVAPSEEFRADLSYLGTYAADRQQTLEELFLKPAGQLPQQQFRIGGAQYPPDFAWHGNIYFSRHVTPSQHPSFYCSSRMTLNVTRRAMKEMGYCPSGRLFEAAACGTPILSDWWEGLDGFFKPGQEILIARRAEDILAALELSDRELADLAGQARQRTLTEHGADHRAGQLEAILEGVSRHDHAPALEEF